jgi:hypothetical protein
MGSGLEISFLNQPLLEHLSFPFSGFFHHARPYRVKHNISAKFREVVLFLHQNGLISSLERDTRVHRVFDYLENELTL